MLPRRIPKQPKRATRWRSQAYTNWIRGFACCVCGSEQKIQAAHVRIGSHTGLGQKPDDFRCLPLCSGQQPTGRSGCHDEQHLIGEATFWRKAKANPEALIAEFIAAAPSKLRLEIQLTRSLRQ